MEAEQKATEQPQSQRSFVIPGAEVVVQTKHGAPMPIDQLLAIVFQIASSNPEGKVEFWLKVQE